jgi:hypothetical protein
MTDAIKTPWNPSRSATLRVKDPLPAPTACPKCSAPVELVSNAVIYGREYGEWPWIFNCTSCDCRVGLHPFTGIPLGHMADAPTREARKSVKNGFNALWNRKGTPFKTRTDAYHWLAGAMKLPVSECHFGMFDIRQCQQAAEAIRNGV